MRWISLLLALILAACDSHEGHDHDSRGGHAAHSPRYGGQLVDLDHVIQVEFILDAAAGKLSAAIHDSHVEKRRGLKMKSLPVEVNGKRLSLMATSDPIKGDRPGDCAWYETYSASLRGLEEFDGVLRELTFLGHTWRDVEFRYLRR